jgi:hypothetical protein
MGYTLPALGKWRFAREANGMHRRQAVVALLPALCLLPLLSGCGAAPGQPSEPATPKDPTAGSAFDPATAGTIRGQVTWTGDLPSVAPLTTWSFLKLLDPPEGRHQFDNPHAPRIDPKTRGVAGAVVFLKGVDARRGRRWDHPPVRVEQRGYQLHVRQGDADGQVGFVQRGAAVEVVSGDAAFDALHADGAAFFSLVFPDPNEPRTRSLPANGLVELTSAAGHFWMRGYLFVDEHPYYTHTDEQGRFILPQVPPGHYEAVCWLPSWREAEHQRDPETSLITRLIFKPPVERRQSLSLEPGQTRTLSFTWSMEMFPH